MIKKISHTQVHSQVYWFLMETVIHDGGGDHLIHGDREPRCLIARTVIVSEVGRVVMLNKTYRGW